MTETEVPPVATSQRRIKRLVFGIVGAAVLVVAGVVVYATLFNDAPAELDETDLSDALVATTALPAPTTASAAIAPAAAPVGTATSAGFDGDWVPTPASEFGYRVEEVLAGVNTTAVGRSNDIDGLLTIAGTSAVAVDVTVQIANMSSDKAVRDGQFRGRIMSADEFPTARFRSTAPIEFGSIPVGDEQIAVTAVGELTLRGVTKPVSFDVTAQTTDGRIGVLGSIPIVFDDFGIPAPSIGPAHVEDHGLVEFVLVFEPV